MATIINNPSGTAEGTGGVATAVLVVAVIGLVLGGLFLLSRLPAFQNDTARDTPAVEVPDRVQIDVVGGGEGEGAN